MAARQPVERVNVPDDDPLQLLLWDLLGVLPAGATAPDYRDHQKQAAEDIARSAPMREQIEREQKALRPDGFAVWHSLTTAGHGRRRIK